MADLDYSEKTDKELSQIKRTSSSRSREFAAARKEQNRRAALDPLNCISIGPNPSKDRK
jgi:hypothetical protein